MEKYLGRLTNVGRAFIDEEFLESSNDIHIEDSQAWEQVAQLIYMSPIQQSIEEVVKSESTGNSHKTDGKLAYAIHSMVNIPRMYAMDTSIWHYLTCIGFPEYVRYRWTNRSGRVAKERFLGGIKRNAFARLWWAAEILHNEEDYSLVEDCFEVQDLYEAVFGRSLSKYPPAAKVFINSAKGKTRKAIRESAKAINLLLSTFILEDLSESYFQSLIQSQLEAHS